MVFKRKAYKQLLEWKNNYADSYSILVEGARRVGKSTLVEEFAKNEYKSYILIDFSNASDDIMDCFEDINNLNRFFLRLQTVTGTELYEHDSVIVFDEIQLFPKARQAIKFLVKDGRYHYIETGSLISIKKNIKDIVIPSEEMKINLYPLDYEEFLMAIGDNSYNLTKKFYDDKTPTGQSLNRKLLKDFRIYMAVGGMPQAVNAYIENKNFVQIDRIKREIISLYEDDFRKIDSSGKLSMMYRSIPAQLSKNKKFSVSAATGKRKTSKDDERIFDLIDSKTVLVSYNTNNPQTTLSDTKDLDYFKLYVADTGLFVTMMFMDRPETENEIYAKLLSDKLPANLGFLYENVVAQMIVSSNRELYYHTWEKKNSNHKYEVDFLISHMADIYALEVQSSGTGKHESIDEFKRKYSGKRAIVISQKDLNMEGDIEYIPIYMTPYLLEVII